MASKITVVIDAETRKAIQGLGKFANSADKSLRSVQKDVQQVQKSTVGLGASFRRVGEFAAGAFAAQAIISGLRTLQNEIRDTIFGVANLGDEIAKTSDKLGVGVEALQELRFAAGRAGIETNSFDIALQRFTRRASEAAQGFGEARGALQNLGVTLTDNQGRLRPTEELLQDVANGFADIPDQAKRVQLAFKLFDTEGVQLVNLLQRGGDELQRFRDEARRFGIVTEEQARQAEQFADAQQDLSAAAEGARIALGTILLPAVQELTVAFTQFLTENRESIRQFGIALLDISAAFFAFVDPIERSLRALIAVFREFGEVTANVVNGIILAVQGDFEAAFDSLTRGLKQSLSDLGDAFTEDTVSQSIGTAFTRARLSAEGQLFKLEKSVEKSAKNIANTNITPDVNISKITQELEAVLRETEKVGKSQVQLIQETRDRQLAVIDQAIKEGLDKDGQAAEARVRIIEDAEARIAKLLESPKESNVVLRTQEVGPQTGAAGAGNVGSLIAGGVGASSTPGIGDAIQGIVTNLVNAFKQGGREGGVALVQAIGDFLIPGLGQLLGFFSQGAEAVRMQIVSVIESLPEIAFTIIETLAELPFIILEAAVRFVEELAERLPEFIEKFIVSFVTQTPKLIIAFIKAIPRIITAIIRSIPQIISAFIEALVVEIPTFIFEVAKGIAEAIGNLLGGIGQEGGLFGTGLLGSEGIFGIKGIPLFEQGGTVPPDSRFFNDRAVIGVSGGEEVLDRATAEKLTDFLNGQGQAAQSGPVQVNLVIGQQQLASAILDLNKKGFRTA